MNTEMKTRIIGITETSPGTWRVTFNGSVLGDSRGYDRSRALAEAKTYVERNGGLDGDWGPTGWVEMRNILDPALEPKAEEAPVASDSLENGTAAIIIKRQIERFGANVAGALEWLESAKAAEKNLAENGSVNIRATAESGAKSNQIAIDAYKEAVKHAEFFGSPNDWESIRDRLMVHVANLGQDYTASIYPVAAPVEDVKPLFAPVQPAHSESKFWAWFDATNARALETDDGKEFAAAGFKLDHTGGGCTAWRRDIEATGWAIVITTDDSGHGLTAEDVANGGHYVVFVQHNEDDAYSASEAEGTAFEAVCRANKMQGIVLAGGNFRRSLGIS